MTQDEILDQIAQLRAVNKELYMELERVLDRGDKTMELIKRIYARDPEGAKKWHGMVLANDIKIMELTKKLCE